MTHYLKISPEIFEFLIYGLKPMEIRYYNDCNFKAGDKCILECIGTGRQCVIRLKNVSRLDSEGMPGYVALIYVILEIIEQKTLRRFKRRNETNRTDEE